MAKRTKMPTDLNARAKAIVDLATSDEDVEEPVKDEARAAGGAKGGRSRADKLTAEERSEIARKAADARWGRPVKQPPRTGRSHLADREPR